MTHCVDNASTATKTAADSAAVEAIAFVGAVLAPFFLNDPRTGEAPDAFAALAELDVDAAAAEWPFADESEARAALALMRAGLAAGADHDDLVWEYRRLFVGPGRLPAPPWGSVYTDHDCVIFGESTTRGCAPAESSASATSAPRKTTSASCWPCCPFSLPGAPSWLTSTCAITCSPGRLITWKGSPRRPITPSTAALLA